MILLGQENIAHFRNILDKNENDFVSWCGQRIFLQTKTTEKSNRFCCLVYPIYNNIFLVFMVAGDTNVL